MLSISERRIVQASTSERDDSIVLLKSSLMERLARLKHYLLCDTHLLIRMENNSIWLECPTCKYRTAGWSR